MRQPKEFVMPKRDDKSRRTLREALLARWRDWRRKRNALAELDCCGSEGNHIAHDIGVTPAELGVLAAKRPDSAALLYPRLAALHLDAKTIATTQGAVMRDLQRLCTACNSKVRCERDLATDASSPQWQAYCPNTSTLTALAEEAETEQALRRLEHGAARTGRTT
jgi:uncharacterized protein YjiS (DUF1127 family)